MLINDDKDRPKLVNCIGTVKKVPSKQISDMSSIMVVETYFYSDTLRIRNREMKFFCLQDIFLLHH